MSWDPIWEKIYSSQNWGKYPGEDLIRFIARNFYQVHNRQTVRVLELGCGPGANLWFIAREGFTVYGIDGSETAVELATKRLNNECHGWQGEVITSDFKKLPYPDNFFHAVIDNESVCCNSYEDSKEIYKEASRVLIGNGKIFSRTFATTCWGDGTGEKVGKNAYMVSEGPISGKGYARFTDYNEINDLFECFMINEVELISRQAHNRVDCVKEWVISGTKK
ncbi:class I SAM-dependent methyltransferase [Paenibacillus qinlingensis]|uniref:class I SAM-dependent methyltransferase n=1 Tax=Paenibacillus qinlingensis TaxID=1837343 RepID=UPI0015630B97|nr:class I SAM-dependent methyltransferase [Paenibacillus qinlingensis]NQX61918.1 class I SAM-dependent methyltransferase [Paenibacillus qinlingensis]